MAAGIIAETPFAASWAAARQYGQRPSVFANERTKLRNKPDSLGFSSSRFSPMIVSSSPLSSQTPKQLSQRSMRTGFMKV